MWLWGNRISGRVNKHETGASLVVDEVEVKKTLFFTLSEMQNLHRILSRGNIFKGSLCLQF